MVGCARVAERAVESVERRTSFVLAKVPRSVPQRSFRPSAEAVE